ncbi:MAG: FAD-dependent oxidoreductase [Deltaproteobacteria bacterium]|nr:FAD-dependent oxidoreductase [Deltaproteobacteria bacterium]
MTATALRNEIKGEVLEQSSPGFDAALAGLLWNQLRADRRPDVIIRVRDEQDVVKAVKFADSNGLRVVARGGGHSWCGLAARNGGMFIDLEQLNEIVVEPALRRASIQPFVSLYPAAQLLRPHGA